MKERPILFSGEMVRAILDGRKTQTRRIVKFHKPFEHHSAWPTMFRTDDGWWSWTNGRHPIPQMLKAQGRLCPYGAPGDRLWVREGWHTDEPDLRVARAQHEDVMSASPICYRADLVNKNAGCIWRPSIHMPRWASRITLEIKNVRVERLQDIGEEDAKAEGFNSRDELKTLWDKINGKRAPWDSDPWVWVVEFERVEQ